MSKGFRPVDKSHPCPACHKPDWCAWTGDGLLRCERSAEVPPGMRLVEVKNAGAVFAPVGGHNSTWAPPHRSPRPAPQMTAASPSRALLNWTKEADLCESQLSSEQRDRFAKELGVTPASLTALGCGWATGEDLRRYRAGGAGWSEDFPEAAYTFPERDWTGRVVGLSLRAADGRKGFPSKTTGAGRGLIVPPLEAAASGPVLIVEGASDVAAALSMGLTAVGRPSAAGGGEQLAKILSRREVLVVGENDAKDSGAWPGRDGAGAIARRLASAWEAEVRWTMPPAGAKDIRSWLKSQACDLADPVAAADAGRRLLGLLESRTESVEPEPSPKQSEVLVRLALEQFRIGFAEGNEPFVVRHDGPNLATMFRGGREDLRALLARAYRARFDSVPGATAVADALTVLAGMALECEPEPAHLRLAAFEGSVVLDLGGRDGAAVVIRPGEWEVVERSPVLFRRTALTGELPRPERPGDVKLLRELLNIADDAWPLTLGWLAASLVPGIPHPILMLGGEQGTGKTTAARYLLGLFDPSPAPVRSAPRQSDEWAVSAAGSWGIAIDNISRIPEWLSDALCKAVTGEGWLRRRLYTDSDIAVLSFRRVIALTSIDAGALRGDLGDRLLVIDLERIPDERRRTEAELEAAYLAARPRILAGLLDLVAEILTVIDEVHPPALPRMADFARLLAAMDRVLGTNAYERFMDQRGRIAGDVLEADPVGAALMELLQQVGEWTGPMKDLLARITPDGPRPKDWPSNPKSLSGVVRRLAPALRCCGVEVVFPETTDKTRRYVVRPTAQTARPPVDGRCGSGTGTCDAAGRAVGPPPGLDRPPDRPVEEAARGGENADFGRLGGSGGPEALVLDDTQSARSCPACRQRRWWRACDGSRQYTCGSCHPPVPGLNIEWIHHQTPQGGAQ